MCDSLDGPKLTFISKDLYTTEYFSCITQANIYARHTKLCINKDRLKRVNILTIITCKCLYFVQDTHHRIYLRDK